MAGIIHALNGAGDRVSVGSAGRGHALTQDHDIPGTSVTRLAEVPDPSWPKVQRIWRGLTWGAATRAWIQEMDPAPDVILTYGTSLGYLMRLIPLARRRRIPLVIDAVEWYQSSHLPGGRLGPFAAANAVSMRLAAFRADGVIVISRFLEQHFNRNRLPTLRVPPLFTLPRDADSPALRDRPMRLCYVGSPGRKDQQSLRNLVRLPGELALDATQLSIKIVGLSNSAAKTLLGADLADSIDNECVEFLGRLPSGEARRIIAGSHFSVLQRREQRYAQAGFPSKVPESLLLGTPVMANITSDLADFLVDRSNARVVPSAELPSLVRTVSEVLREPYSFDRGSIAREASEKFSPERYAGSIHDFLIRCLAQREASGRS
ncbi:glycosyltransferase [Cryobacterium psychrotolerans]